MKNNDIIGVFLVALLLGGIVLLLTKKQTARQVGNFRLVPDQPQPTGNIRLVPDERRYHNKETRRIEYNTDGLPTLIEITRDYAVT